MPVVSASEVTKAFIDCNALGRGKTRKGAEDKCGERHEREKALSKGTRIGTGRQVSRMKDMEQNGTLGKHVIVPFGCY